MTKEQAPTDADVSDKASAKTSQLKKQGPSSLPRKEQAILIIFRDYLMTPGKMLCLSNLDRQIYGASLAKLVAKKLLVAEGRKDGYSLTESGYFAMRACRTTAP